MSKRIKRTYTITANPEMMAKIDRFLGVLHFFTNWGSSRTIAISEDGDGADHVTVTVDGAELTEHREFAKWLSGQRGTHATVCSCDNATMWTHSEQTRRNT